MNPVHQLRLVPTDFLAPFLQVLTQFLDLPSAKAVQGWLVIHDERSLFQKFELHQCVQILWNSSYAQLSATELAVPHHML